MTASADLVRRFAGHRLLLEADLGDPDAQSVILGEGADRLDIVVSRVAGLLAAYVNECPHAFTPLETWQDRFLTLDEERIICSTHAALFRIEDGYCTSGPCAGKSLIPIPIKVVDGEVRIAL